MKSLSKMLRGSCAIVTSGALVLSTFPAMAQDQPPPGAQQIARSDHCSNQAFVLRDRHLLLQSHLEMTPELVGLSLERNGEQLRRQFALGNPAVSDPADAPNDLEARTARMRTILTRLYARWVRTARRQPP